jgi:hypothetical protein
VALEDMRTMVRSRRGTTGPGDGLR